MSPYCATRPQWVKPLRLSATRQHSITWANVDPDPCHLDHNELTHWGRVTHICVGELTNIGSDNGLSPGQRQAIIWTNAGILLIGPSGTNFSEISIKILTFSFAKMRLKVSSAKWRPFCLGLNMLSHSVFQQEQTWTFQAHFTKKVNNIGFITVHGLNEGHMAPYFTEEFINIFNRVYINLG